MTENYLDILQRTILENWDEPALTDFYLTEDGTAQDTSRGNSYTYGEMYGEMMRLGELFRLLGLQKGDHIAICGSNSANWAVAYLAIAAFQGVAVTVLHSQNIEDIASQIDFSDSVALFTDNDLWDELQSHNLPQVKHVISLADWSILHGELTRENYERTTREKLRKQLEHSKLSAGIEPDDLAMICFTSGSSGVTKGVMLSNRSISNNAKNTIDGYPNDEITNFLSVLPMAHIYGLMTEILAQLMKGKHVDILMIFSIRNLYCGIKIAKPYALSLIPLMVSSLIRTHQDWIFLLRTCKQIYIGGSIFDEEVENQLLTNNIPISIGYGQTETGPLISYSITAEYKQGTCGKIVEGMQAKFSPEGEILVKGENVMLGYYKNPEATVQKIDKDGWLHTGDAGYMDEDGYLYVTGRIGQDMIVLPNGENIHPEDIENKLNALPEIKESIVIAREGRLVALVVLEQGTKNKEQRPLTLKEQRHAILRAINPQLPDYSQLYSIDFIDQPLERTAKQTIKRYLYK